MTDRTHTLTGSLGVGSIVFMVVAAAAPLTVIAGTVPLGIAIGNGAAFPATFALSAVVLLLFAVGFCADEPRTCRTREPSTPTSSAGWAGSPGWARRSSHCHVHRRAARRVRLHRRRRRRAGAALRRPRAALVAVVRWSRSPSSPCSATGGIELSSEVLGVLLIAEVAIVLVFDAVVVGTGGGAGPVHGVPGADADRFRLAGRGPDVRRSPGSSGSRPPRCSATRPATRPHDPAGHLPGAGADRRVLHALAHGRW